jgi:hypothetical protein
MYLLRLILPVLAELFNYILTSSTFRLVWKIFSVVPIPKVHSLQRSLTIALFLFYLSLQRLLKMLCTSIYYVSRNGLISLFPSGFRPGHSTGTAIAKVSDDIRLNMESNQPTILVLLDFSNAFDSVCYGLFILKLRQRYGFHATAAVLVSLIFFLGIKKLRVGTMLLL